jgi:polysaccharide export outer membrane protein
MTRKLIGAVCLAVLAAAPRAAAHAQEPGPAAAARSADGHGGDYRIGPEDLLQITVWKNEAMSREVPVRPDGMISLPLLNDVPAAGLTPMQLRESLIKRLSEYIPSPEVSVIVQAVRSPKVSILGQVVHPGRYDLKGRTTVLDLLAQAGGLNEFAARSRIVVLRANGPKTERIRFDYDKAMSDGARQNFDLRAGDIVLVR